MERTTRSIFLFCLTLSTVAPSPACAQDSSLVDIQGTIVDSATGLPIEDVEVSLAEMGLHLPTDSLSVPPGSLLTTEIGLTVEPIRLDPLKVTVEGRNLALELAGFYDRRDREPGVFLTRESIEARHPATTVDLFEGIVGVRVVREGTRHRVAPTGNRAMSLLHDPSKKPCYPAVWIDGILKRRPAFSTSHGDLPTIDELVGPHDIAGLEVYQSTGRIPVQFNVQGACGVMVVWRRSGG